jgi:hypothetical protein
MCHQLGADIKSSSSTVCGGRGRVRRHGTRGAVDLVAGSMGWLRVGRLALVRSRQKVSKTVQLGEPLRSNWPIYSALHVTVWGVCGFGVGVRSGGGCAACVLVGRCPQPLRRAPGACCALTLVPSWSRDSAETL